MKKLTALLLVFLLSVCLFACDNGEGPGEEEKHYMTVVEYTLKSDTTIEDMAKAISKKYGFSMPMDISDKTLETLYYITPSAVSEYAGIFSISMSSADNILIVKPQSGKVAVVKYGFDQRKQDIMDTFTGYLEESYKQAENSITIERDGYYIFACINEEQAAFEEYINTFFDITEKQVEVSGPADDQTVPDGAEGSDPTTQDDMTPDDGADVESQQ